MMMKTWLLISLALCLPLGAALAQKKPRGNAQPKRAGQANKQSKIFPYTYYIDDLSNGLRLVTVPTDFPNLVSVYTIVQTGSRNEVEPGKSGYAHFFEHLMFRGSKNFTADQRDEVLKRAGASTNASTWDDRTVYYATFSKEDLPKVLELEADRFQRLQYAEPEYKTEALAVLGEYNKSISDPSEKLYEALRETAYKNHTYSHTTLGYLKDIQDMPNQYDYSWKFYNRYYRPEYATILIVGDVTHEQALALTKKHFGEWKRGDYQPEIPPEPSQTEPREAQVDWPSQTLPQVVVAFRGPAYSDEVKDKAALTLLAPLAFGENSDLYQRLVLKEQKVDALDISFPDQIDPELFYVQARVKEEKDVPYVRDQILATYKKYATELVPQDKLDATRARQRYSVALSLNSSDAIARTLAPYIGLKRTPESMNKLFALYGQITPEDIRAIAAKYFKDNNRTIVTLSAKPANKESGN